MKTIRKISKYYYEIYNHHTGKQMFLLSLSLLFGFFWALGGALLYLFGRFKEKKIYGYGVMALTGAGINLIFYIVQVLVKAYSIGA